MSAEDERHSKAFDAELIADPVERAKREARDGLRQYDYLIEAIDYWLSSDRAFRLRPSLILQLNRIALEGISARALSYLILCIRLGEKLPGTLTIPDQISRNKTPYYAALESADSAFRNGAVEVNELEKLLKNSLAAQLLSVVKAADEPGRSRKK